MYGPFALSAAGAQSSPPNFDRGNPLSVRTRAHSAHVRSGMTEFSQCDIGFARVSLQARWR